MRQSREEKAMKKIAATLVVGMALAGCSPYYGGNPHSKVVHGAIAGAVVGGVVGAVATGGNAGGILVGAGIGAAAGAAIASHY
jgi:hypothetical protein